MTEQAVTVTDRTHDILKAYKEKEGINIKKQIEILINESPRYKGYREASK